MQEATNRPAHVSVAAYRDDPLYPRIARAVADILRWGKGPKQRLRFTKTGSPGVEEAYARHFIWPGKGPFHPPHPDVNNH